MENIKGNTIVNNDKRSCVNCDQISFLSNKYPKYKWNKNFGYGTSQHLSALKKFGVTNYHRRSYKPVHNILSK